MICRSSDIFYRFGNTTKKRAAEIEVISYGLRWDM